MSHEMTDEEWQQMNEELFDTDWELLYNNQTEILANKDELIKKLERKIEIYKNPENWACDKNDASYFDAFLNPDDVKFLEENP